MPKEMVTRRWKKPNPEQPFCGWICGCLVVLWPLCRPKSVCEILRNKSKSSSWNYAPRIIWIKLVDIEVKIPHAASLEKSRGPKISLIAAHQVCPYLKSYSRRNIESECESSSLTIISMKNIRRARENPSLLYFILASSLKNLIEILAVYWQFVILGNLLHWSWIFNANQRSKF